MRIAIASDVHLEFGDLILKNEKNADVLILSGDICVASDFRESDGIIENGKSQRYVDFFKRCTFEFPKVIYIAGNHEHYNGDYAETFTILRNYLGHIENLHILDKEHITIDDVTFIGGTLWTDMNNEDSDTLYNVNSMMNDFQVVKNGNKKAYRRFKVYKKNLDGEYATDENGRWIQEGVKSSEYVPLFSTEDALEDHKKMMHYIDSVIYNKFDEKFVVVGHHAPSKQSTHPRYKDDTIMNGGYSSDLTKFILKNPQIKAWTHGHTHDQFDYMVGSTRVLCNPRGYVNYERESNEKEPYFAKVFEV